MSEYIGPIVTTDAVVLRNNGGTIEVLLHERPAEPFAGALAIPGVYVQRGEEILSRATARALRTKAGFGLDTERREPRVVNMQDSIGRDPRGHAISIVTVTLLPMSETEDFEPKNNARWVADYYIDGLAFDHGEILKSVRDYLSSRMWSDPYVLRGLIGDSPLSTSNIKAAAGSIGMDEATSNFRRKLVDSGLFVPSSEKEESHSGPGRPSRMWEWANSN